MVLVAPPACRRKMVSGLSPTGYLEIDLGVEKDIDEIYIRNRRDCCQNRIINTTVMVLDGSPNKYLVWKMDLTTQRDIYKLPVSTTTNGKRDTDIAMVS